MSMLKHVLVTASVITVLSLSVQPAVAKVTAAICIAAQEKGLRVYELAKATPKLYPTDADAKAAADAAFTKAVLAEDIYKTEYTGTGRSRQDYLEAILLCRNAKAPYIAKAAGLFAELAKKAAPSPKTR